MAEYNSDRTGANIDATLDKVDALVDSSNNATVNSLTSNGDISLGDSDKATFGASDDLQIYHDGSNSVIHDNGTGDLILKANSFKLWNNTSSEALIVADVDGAVKLYHDGSQKLTTTSTGVDVTGTVTADGLTVENTFGINLKSQISQLPTADDNSNVFTTSGSGSGFFSNFGALGISSRNKDTASSDIGFFTKQNLRLQIADNGDVSFYEDTGTTAKMVWDASAESLGIGTSSPERALDVVGDVRIKKTGANVGMRITADNNREAYLIFGDPDDPSTGGLAYDNATDSLSFDSNNAERMRLDGSGNLLVGTTDNNVYNDSTGTGTVIQSNGIMQLAASGGTPLYLNRQASDGTIQEFRKDGSTVGSIGTVDSDLLIHSTASNHVGLRFGNGYVGATDDTGQITNGAADLGLSSSRFKDLYLSGGVYLGGTGAANKLDDYEEGTWVPELSFGGSTTGITYNPSYRFCTYTKVGRTVTCRVGFYLTSKGTATGLAKIDGLPFIIKSLSYRDATCIMGFGGTNNITTGIIGVGGNGADDIYLRKAGDLSLITEANFNDNSFIYATFVYDTDQ